MGKTHIGHHQLHKAPLAAFILGCFWKDCGGWRWDLLSPGTSQGFSLASKTGGFEVMYSSQGIWLSLGSMVTWLHWSYTPIGSPTSTLLQNFPLVIGISINCPKRGDNGCSIDSISYPSIPWQSYPCEWLLNSQKIFSGVQGMGRNDATEAFTGMQDNFHPFLQQRVKGWFGPLYFLLL